MSELPKIKVNSVDEFLAEVKGIKRNNYTECLFRGLPNSEWIIKSTASLRFETGFYYGTKFDYEQDIGREFRYNQVLITDYRHKSFSKDNKSEIAQTDLGILAQLRHYGAATSLIDFTKNPLVALWFACNEESQSINKDGAVYTLGIRNRDDFIHIYSAEQLREYTIREIFSRSYSSSPYIDRCFYWQPGHLNERISAQSSYFVIGSKNLQREVEENKVIHINGHAKVRILAELSDVHNINRLSLFPDISGFAEANGKDVPIREAEEFRSEVRLYTEMISNVQKGLRNLNAQNSVGIRYELGMLLIDRGNAKLNLGDREEGIRDIRGGRELLIVPRDVTRKNLEKAVGGKIDFEQGEGPLEEIVNFVNEHEDNKNKCDECIRMLQQLLEIEVRIGGEKNLEIIVNTILELYPTESSAAYFTKASNYLKRAENEEDSDSKINYLEKAIECINKEEGNIFGLQKELRKAMLYSQIISTLKAAGKKFADYIEKEKNCYQKALKKDPNDPFALTAWGIHIVRELEGNQSVIQEKDMPNITKRYMEAIEYFNNAIKIMPKDLKFRLNRGNALYQLAKVRKLNAEERNTALTDLRLFERNYRLHDEVPSYADGKESIVGVQEIIKEIEKLKTD